MYESFWYGYYYFGISFGVFLGMGIGMGLGNILGLCGVYCGYLWVICEGFGRKFWGFLDGLGEVFLEVLLGCILCVWRYFFCEVSETTIPSVSKF